MTIQRDFLKGNEALAYGALRAGLNAYFAYPITPSSEIPETLAKEFRNPNYREFKVFLQAASELEAINMVIGAASTGVKVMTATSGPGFSLKQEGLSYAAGMEVPFLVVDVNRAGPGLGNLGPEQTDYFQATKGGGHGGYRNIVLAPNSVQEMASFPGLAFSLAFKYRNPAVILADAFLGQLKEDLVFPEIMLESFDTPWATTGARGDVRHVLSSLNLDFEAQSSHSEGLKKKYEEIDRSESRFESYLTDDAEIVLVAYGIVSRLSKEVVDGLRNKGVRAGLFRPITLNPFPHRQLSELSGRVRKFLVIELNMGQMLFDVKLAVNDPSKVDFMYKLGGLLPTTREIERRIMEAPILLG
ncbi:MAG TPA: 3-methyl-2-oxobutanoate dehydrogenase subunit VorB [Nitrososphaerales archaeon]|nr:3-methyl-2-oxobutanoate dehydrogenase subunit VorB [Nitrososphaerales archaeon]